MKWVLSQQSPDNHKWLLQDDQRPAQITYNLLHHSIRIKSKSNRLFFLDVAGFFQKKILLRSEYGVVIGEAQFTQTLEDGTLLMNEEKYYFGWNNNKLSLFDKNRSLLSTAIIDHTGEWKKREQFALIFCTAWIVYSSTTSRMAEDMLVA